MKSAWDGRYRAARTLQTGFAVARHVADAPSLAFALLGTAIGSMMLGRLEGSSDGRTRRTSTGR